MAVDVKVPPLGESVTEGVIVRWLKEDGTRVEPDEPLLELETEKAAMEINADVAGTLQIVTPAGARVRVGETVARIAEEAVKAPEPQAAPPPTREPEKEPQPVTVGAPATPRRDDGGGERPRERGGNGGGPSRPRESAGAAGAPAAPSARPSAERDVERVPMSELRRTVAARLVEARQTAAILTTFNEIDLGELLAIRARHREGFRARHGVDLGLMSLFARATVLALREVRIVNARIDGGDVVYHHRIHLGIAVSTPRGLVVPVVRHADVMSVAELERTIGELARRARDAKLKPDELGGGTFTITNGGIFGSLLSTPLLNPPQSGILGMHAIKDRPVAREGQVVIRPMMYVALSYDHRLVDGEQAVTFLVRVKQLLEDPARMVIEA
jgi:2-oxoglutarate dehydrogenase E2 component (dihydrolipoamide succinyltransferase)